MKESRLLEGQATDFEANLLRAAAMESPTEEQSARMLAPVGLGGAATGATGSGGVSTGGGSTAGVGTGSALTTKLWLGGMGLALGLGAVVVSLTEAPSPNPAVTAPVAAPSVMKAETEGEGDAADADEDAEDLQSETSPEEEAARTPAQRPSSAKSPAASSADTLSAEMQLLDQARSALATDPARALSLLRTYEARFPKGVLRPEATVLRVDALEKSGSSQAANELRGEFLEKNPTSAHKRRLEGPSGSAP